MGSGDPTDLTTKSRGVKNKKTAVKVIALIFTGDLSDLKKLSF